MAANPSFGLVIPSRPVLVNPEVVSPAQVAFTFASAPSFSHITVFLLPGIVLPNDTLASIYVQLPGSKSFQLLGAIGNEKQSAIFKITGTSTAKAGGFDESSNGSTVIGDEMSDVGVTSAAANGESSNPGTGNITIGISVEPAQTVLSELAALESQNSTASTALILNRSQQRSYQIPTKVMAQRIIQNAFNFLASFAGPAGLTGEEEVVSMKSFQDWWSKFQRRIENDPTFLEKVEED